MENDGWNCADSRYHRSSDTGRPVQTCFGNHWAEPEFLSTWSPYCEALQPLRTHQKGPMKPQTCRTNVVKTPMLAASCR
jgi:hypothetical protein